VHRESEYGNQKSTKTQSGIRKVPIKNTLDAAAINVRRPKLAPRKEQRARQDELAEAD
jgi:hypothetical protein